MTPSPMQLYRTERMHGQYFIYPRVLARFYCTPRLERVKMPLAHAGDGSQRFTADPSEAVVRAHTRAGFGTDVRRHRQTCITWRMGYGPNALSQSALQVLVDKGCFRIIYKWRSIRDTCSILLAA